jgi:hypothetical protein
MRIRIEAVALSLFVALALWLTACGSGRTATAEEEPPVDVIPDAPPLPTFPPLPPTATPAAAPTRIEARTDALLSTDFSTANSMADWTIIDGSDLLAAPSTWLIADGVMRQAGDLDQINADYLTAAVTGDPAWTDYQVKVAAYSSGNDEMGVVARASADGYYVFRVRNAERGANQLAILRYDAADVSFVELAVVSGGGFTPGQWHELAISVVGDQISGSLDGTVVVQTTDPTLTSGTAGVFGAAAAELQFDDFAVFPSIQ